MNHFKLTGSPKCKNYMPRHRLADQYTVSATRTATTQATTGHETSGAISCKLFKLSVIEIYELFNLHTIKFHRSLLDISNALTLLYHELCSLTAFDGFVTNIAASFPQLTVQLVTSADKKWAIIHGKIDIDSLSQSPCHNPRMIVTCENEVDVSFSFEVNFISVQHGQLPGDKEFFDKVIASLLPGSFIYY